jgi:hypothetical protein
MDTEKVVVVSGDGVEYQGQRHREGRTIHEFTDAEIKHNELGELNVRK